MQHPYNHRVLLVDDEPSIRATLPEILKTRGYEVRTASDGIEGLAALNHWLPDLVISDLRMPNMDGFEFLARIRRSFPQIFLIAISGEYGAIAPNDLVSDAFFQKGSYSPAELLEKMSELLSINRQSSAAEKFAAWREAVEKSVSSSIDAVKSASPTTANVSK